MLQKAAPTQAHLAVVLRALIRSLPTGKGGVWSCLLPLFTCSEKQFPRCARDDKWI
jgi:hypothetical protein